ncbi:IS21 family transposase [Legionella pneumophila]|nr:IS21 family transposase [Legionella pneumophila]RYB32757.1 IS21 family transposase [Legionella pneumophila]RYW22216.1 IS21 family transposase [Legionella pneumophila]HAU1564348.1 IS21 family transposase [Legionella pneumophila]HAU4159577.1 IS21 family transposase [Legionella pneumophila]
MRPLSMRKIQEVFRQHEQGHSNRDIGRSLNISSGTVSNYLYRARVAGLTLAEALSLGEQELYERLFLPSKASSTRRVLPDWECIHAELRKKGMTLMVLWREYRECHPDGVGYSQFCDRYKRYIKQISPVMRQVHKAGEKVFVDYAGMTVPWIEPSTGEIHEAQVFVASLGASQFTFVDITESQSLEHWISSHIRMWNTFGGVTKIVVPDNLKSGVSKSHRYDPDINANYQHVSEHYGFAIVPARAARPQDKAKVENAVGCVERQILAPLRHHTFTSIAEIKKAIAPKLAAFNQQSFQKMNTSRLELFEALDKPALHPLPSEPYHYAEWKKAKVNIDYHFVFDEHYYSVPYQYIHKTIEVRASGSMVECFHEGKRITLHTRSKKRFTHTTLAEHMPSSHKAHAEWTPERIHRWALKTGEDTARYIEYMIAARAFPEQAFRSCLGLMRLAQRFGADRLDNACTIALEAGMTRYQQVERLLKNNMDLVKTPSKTTTPVISHHNNLRGSNYYQ